NDNASCHTHLTTINLTYRYFFFSSRRRHTRFSRDWSSDVCSSDLGWQGAVEHGPLAVSGRRPALRGIRRVEAAAGDTESEVVVEIGRASCRERVYVSGAAATSEQRSLELLHSASARDPTAGRQCLY